MATREEYNACIAARLKGQTFTGEERKQAFCVSAKMCSGKVESEAEAQRICLLPKEPKPPKAPKQRRGKGNRGKGTGEVASCLLPKLTPEMTLADLTASLQECGYSKSEPTSEQQEAALIAEKYG